MPPASKATTGKPQWRKEFGAPAFGTATSPLVDRGLLVAYVGTNGRGALTAFEAQTGVEKWSWSGDGPGYASPIVTDLAGTRQVITQSQHNIVGVSAATGELLWRIPFSTPYEQNIVTPALYHDTLLNGVLYFTVPNHTWAVDARTGRQIWHFQRQSGGNMIAQRGVAIYKDRVYFGTPDAHLICLDARNGATLWASEGRQADNAAVIDGGSVLFLLTNDAELIVARKTGKGFEPLRKYSVADSPTWAHPVVLNNGILIKDLSTLALWGTD